LLISLPNDHVYGNRMYGNYRIGDGCGDEKCDGDDNDDDFSYKPEN